MKGKIACSATRLGLLEPAMVQSVVEANAFQIGKQYSSDNRVRITEANDLHLTSAVMGNSGLYEQTIQLKDGFLDARCTCTLSEQPLCRHGVAALLEYHRWSKPRPIHKDPEFKKNHESKIAVVPEPAALPANSPDLKLSELTVFIEWMQQAVRSIERGQSVPPQPSSGSGEICSWIRAVRHLDDRRREGEEIQTGLEADLRNREATLARLTQQLEASIDESKALQHTCKDLQRELTSYRGLVAKAGDVTRQFDQFDAEVKAIAGDLAEKSTKLEALADSVKQVTMALRRMDKK